MLTDKIKYKALVDKDVSYEGIFFAAVKTTGIFCRPTCTARKPNLENVEFFNTVKEAILHGYRPCKICNPLEGNWETVTSAAFDSGYESLSGFNDSFKSIFGVSPVNSKNMQILNLTRIETPLGTMFAGAVEQGICLLEFTDRRMLETELKTLTKLLNATIIQGSNKHFGLLQQQLSEYFEGKRKEFSIPLFTPGSEFQQAVWTELQNIPYATTRSYKQQATALKKPDAVRAVANANGMNRIAIIIPCHRVIGNDGTLTGYGGGLWRKKWLLNMEMTYQKNPIYLF